jgi:hypothetical protein
MAPSINWGNVVTDPAQQADILRRATEATDKNEAGSGLGAGTYGPGYSRDQAIQEAAYSFFPRVTGSAPAAPGLTLNTGGVPGGAPSGPPKPTPYGDFAGLDPATFAHSPDYQYLVDSMLKGSQRGAAARGTLLTGDFQKELGKQFGGLAAGDYGAQFGRALDTYNTNRATNQQNFGQQMDAYNGGLSGYNAATNANQGQQRIDLARQDQTFDQNRTTAADRLALQDRQTGLNQMASNSAQAEANAAYAAQVEATRRQNEAYMASRGTPAVAPQRRIPR